MKKLFLLLGLGVATISANAQYNNLKTVVFAGGEQQLSTPAKHSSLSSQKQPGSLVKNSTERTTSGGGGRWYSYAQPNAFGYLYNEVGAVAGTGVASYSQFLLWQDTSAIVADSPTYYQNEWTSVALSFDPYVIAWDNDVIWPGSIMVTPTDSWTIDSIIVVGGYYRADRTMPGGADAGVVDTLVLSLVQGNGGTSNMPFYYYNGEVGDYPGCGVAATDPYIDTLYSIFVQWDSTQNDAGFTPPLVYKYPLTDLDTAPGDFGKYTYAVNMVMTPGNFAGVSVSFRNGDHSYPAFPGTDTLYNTSGVQKYNVFEVGFEWDGSSSSPVFPPYSFYDQNVGFWKREGASDAGYDSLYVPNWAWTTSGGAAASELQYPDIWFHVTCSTCMSDSALSVSTVNKQTSEIAAYPNPANNQLTIAFNMSNNTNDVTISLLNMMGQVVTSQHIQNMSKGQAVFFTGNLPDGVYIYSIESNTEHSTGRVEVMH